MKTLFFIAILAITSCASNKFQSGNYKVVTVKKFNGKSIVHLEGVKKEFVLPTDSLEKDDFVYITALP